MQFGSANYGRPQANPENQEAGLGFLIGHGGRRQGGLGRGNNKQSLLRKRPLIGWVTTVSDWLGSPGDNRWFHPQRFEVIGFK